jgi:nickel-dependent lactate racemase
VLESQAHHYAPDASQTDLVRQALEYPIGSTRLRELARGKHRVVIITSAHTRPVPSKITLPLLLAEVREGNPQADTTILIATGFRRLTTPAEMLSKFGETIVQNER